MKEPLIPGGYILLSRKIIESEIWDKPPLYIKVWIYLLSLAQHKEYKGLKRGQLYTSIPKIQEACSWHVGARKVKPTAREVRSVLDWMRGKSPQKSSLRNPFEQSSSVTSNSNMIVTSKVTHGTLVTIENYDVYQTPANYERHTESHIERHDETSSNVTATTQYKQECIKNDKNEQEIKDNTPKSTKTKTENLCSKEDIESFVESLMASNPLDVNRKLLVSYIDCLRLTRKTARISTNIVTNLWQKWKKYDPDVVAFAMWRHVDRHDDKREEYTLGIMRGTDVHKARQELIKLKNRTDRQEEITYEKHATGTDGRTTEDSGGKWDHFVLE